LTFSGRIHLRKVLAAVAVLFTGAAVYIAVLFEQRQDALSRVSRYDLSWTAAQTANELSRLGQVLGAYSRQNGMATADDVSLRYDLFLSRISLFESPTFQSFAIEDPRNAAIITEMRRAADALAPLVDNLTAPGHVDQAMRIILETAPRAASLASAANHSGAEKVYEDYRSLLHLHWVYSGLTFTLVAGGLVLLWSISRQNDLLARTRMAAEKAQAEAERASRAKTDFLAAMSHEIRTPLHGILGFTDLMLERSDIVPAIRRYAERIRISGLALLTVVNDVLDFSKIEAGAVELDLRPFSVRQLVVNCDSIIRKLAEAKGLALEVEIAPDIDGTVMGDEARLRQILLNLLNNAIKFTAVGKVALSVTRQSDAADRVCFSVTDTGIGIAPDKHDRLFQRFSQVDSSSTRQFGGTGLGLAISRRLVELMGGSIGVESEEGRGSRFWMTIPLPPAEPDQSAEPAAQPKTPARSGRVLLAEDVDINQEIARAVLESAGYSLDIVPDGAKALEAVQQRSYGLVLMDIQMPVMDGITAARSIRALDGPAASVPIVALTANVYREQVAGFLAAGMNDHIAKPFRRDELLSKVERWLGASDDLPGAEGDGGPAPASEPEPEPDPIDDDAFREIEETFGPALTTRLLGRLADLLAAFPAELDAPEDRQRIARAAHSVVSASGQLGFQALSDSCRRLEAACATEGDLTLLLREVDARRRQVLQRIQRLKPAA
jgi:signal transduction histidine kinase/CheY-like chemotaxis protein/HPt (histidine-containing phosphotransfer) domain-containing protein